MKKITLLLLLCYSFVNAQTSMKINGVIDGPLSGGKPKAVEFYVINNISDLSEYGFGSANNGGGSDGVEFTFPATQAAAGSFIWVATDSIQFNTFFGFYPDYKHGIAANINGNDAIELFRNEVLVDVFGDPDTDGYGEDWEYTDGWAHSLGGRPPSGLFHSDQWEYSGPGALIGAATNMDASNPYPVDESALDIRLKSFHVWENEDKVVVEWDIESINNAYSFLLDWSINGVDFEKIYNYKVDKNTIEHMQFIHNEVQNGTNYYRLSSLDDNGLRKVLRVNSISVDKTRKNSCLPFNIIGDRLSFETGNLKADASLFIYSIDGRKKGTYVINKADKNIDIDVSDLPPGLYFIILIGPNFRCKETIYKK